MDTIHFLESTAIRGCAFFSFHKHRSITIFYNFRTFYDDLNMFANRGELVYWLKMIGFGTWSNQMLARDSEQI